MSTSVVGNNTGTRLVGGFIAERSSEWLTKKVQRLTEGLSIRNIGGLVHAMTPSFISSAVRDLGLGLREYALAPVISQAEQWFGPNFTNVIFAPAFEELVFRVGIQAALTITLTAALTAANVPPEVAATTAKVMSVHATAYLFSMAHGPVQTEEGAMRYSRALVRGTVCELTGTSGVTEIAQGTGQAMGLHIAYNFLKKLGLV